MERTDWLQAGFDAAQTRSVMVTAITHHEFGSCLRENKQVRADAALVDRSAEREVLGGLLARAAEGYSGTLVLRGEVGVGKTALLDVTVAAATAAGLQTARLTGVEPETQLGYAGLHRFLLRFADQLEQLPGPQRDALQSTFGLLAAPPADRFLVALAVLTLLAEVASAAPLVCVIDDVQWLDPESAVVLGFVARRLYAEQVVLLFAVRELAGPLPALAGLPELAIGGLDDACGAGTAVGADAGTGEPGSRRPDRGRDRRESAGASGSGPGAVAGPAGGFGGAARAAAYRQLAGEGVRPPGEPTAARDTAAAGGGGGRAGRLSRAVVARGPRAGIDPDAAVSADLDDLAEIGPKVEFRHPLIRSVAYHGTPLWQRRRIHQALAAVAEGYEPDRVAWHLGMAALGPDEAVAARLGKRPCKPGTAAGTPPR